MADRAANDEEQIRGVLDQEHEAFLKGDSDAYCETLTRAQKRLLDGCTFIRSGLKYQQENGGPIQDQEILDLVIEGDRAYAAVYEQRDKESSLKTPSDFELTKANDVWRISNSRYRTEREPGPSKCFLGSVKSNECPRSSRGFPG